IPNQYRGGLSFLPASDDFRRTPQGYHYRLLYGFLRCILGSANQTGEQVLSFQDYNCIFTSCRDSQSVLCISSAFHSHDDVAVGIVLYHYAGFLLVGSLSKSALRILTVWFLCSCTVGFINKSNSSFSKLTAAIASAVTLLEV